MSVDVLELGEVEARRRAADRPEIECVDQLFGGEEFLVAVAPPEPRQIVAQSDRQIAQGAIGVDAERAVALGELGAVRPMNERDMRHDRDIPAERLIDLGLSRSVGQVVVAANDVRHPHVVIIDDDREHVGRIAVRTQQHEVIEILVGEDDLALHLIVDDGFAILARAQTDHGLDAGGRLGRIAVAPATVVTHGLALEAGLLAHLLQLSHAGVTAIGAARAKQLLGDLAMALGALKLADRLAVPIESKPFQPVENRVHRGLRRSLAIRVFDAEQERATEALGVKPVEQSRARASDMQEASRRGREAGDYSGHLRARSAGFGSSASL